MNTILVFLPFSRHIFKDMLAGVTRYFGGGMRVQVIETGTGAAVHRKLLGFWNPVGCIVEASEGVGTLSPRFFGDVPVVYLDRTCARGGMRFLDVRQDYAAGAETAARELLAPDITHYAFVGYRKRTAWSRARGDAFAAAVGLHGHFCTRFEREGSASERANVLRDWLSALPKPCGVFAANDIVAEEVLWLCTQTGIRVPEDLSLIGIDNDEQICENASPALTSACPDFEQSGYLCAELLAARLGNPRLAASERTYGILGVIRRASTCRTVWTDPRVLVALKTIRARACGKIGVNDIAAAMGCSRRLAELRFRETTGRTLRDVIAETRFERATVLLSNPHRAIGAIAQFCGFGTEAALRIAFKKRTGLSMRAWRLRHAERSRGKASALGQDGAG